MIRLHLWPAFLTLLLWLPLVPAADSGAVTAADQVGPPDPALAPDLFDLIAQGNVNDLTTFILTHPNALTLRSTNQEPPLVAALRSSHPETVSILIDHGADVNACDSRCMTPLMVAVQRRDLAAVQLLLKNHADPNCQDSIRCTALHDAVLAGQSAVVAELLSHGADPDKTEGSHGWTPVQLALVHGADALAFQIIAAQCDETHHVNFLRLHRNQGMDDQDFENDLDDHPADMEERIAGGWSLLHEAVVDDRMNAVRFLLDHNRDTVDGAPFNAYTYNRDCDLRCALHYAAELGLQDMVARLIEYHADPNVVDAQKVTPLDLAVQNNHRAVAQALLAAGANPNIVDENGKNLAWALLDCDDAMATLLLSQPLDLDNRDSDGRTLLYALLDKPARFALVLAHMSVVNSVDHDGQTLLQAAAAQKSPSAVLDALLTKNIPIDWTDKNGRTALHLAALHQNAAAVDLLIAHKANLNAVDHLGATPLHYAVYSLPALARLLHADASVGVPDKHHQTALDNARSLHAADAVALLQAHRDFLNDAQAGDLTALQAVFTRLQAAAAAAQKAHADDAALAYTQACGDLVSTRDADGRTPSMLAADAGSVPELNYLAHCGADLSAVDAIHQTLLHWAARGNKPAAIAWLLQHRAAIDAPDLQGHTPLMAAAANGALEAAQALVAAQANLAATDNDGKSAADLAQAAGHKDVANFLAQAAAKPTAP